MNSRLRSSLLRATFLAAFFLAVYEAPAAPGDLDTTFGTGGKVTTDFPAHGRDSAAAVAVLPDGKILAAGTVNFKDGPSNFGLVRYNPNGSLDSSFGAGGKAVTDFSGQFGAMVLQPDGKIILAGYADDQGLGSNFALVRYLPGGQLDPGFGDGGKVITDMGGEGYSEYAFDVALQPDGAILVAGTTNPSGSNSNSVVLRYTTGGTLDGTFGNGGKLITDLGGYDSAYKVALQGDGKIIVGSGVISFLDSAGSVALSRYDSAGHPDATFGTGGSVVTKFGDNGQLTGMIVLSDGKILISGFNFNSSGLGIFLARYLPGGTLDNTFGTGGKSFISHPAGQEEQSSGMALQYDGEILIAAEKKTAAGFLLLRCRANGSLDTGFGVGGRVFTPGLNYYGATCLALQGNGKIIVAGGVTQDSQDDFQVSRYQGTPVLTPLESWRQKWFGISTNTGDAADDFDYDGDGLANLLEWATGLNPTSREASPLAAVLNGTSLSLTYPLSDAALTAGTTLTVEWTDDLSGPWHSDGIVTSTLSDDGNLREMQAVLPAGTGGRRFLRLKASRP